MAEPADIVPEVVEQIQQLPDLELRSRLLAGLIALIDEEEIVNMVEKLIEEEGLLLNTPYLRRLRERSRSEGLVEGRTVGISEGLAEGRAEGLLMGRRRAVLDAWVWRFDPAASIYRQVEKTLVQITTDAELERLFVALLRAEDMVEFQATLPATNGTITTTTE